MPSLVQELQESQEQRKRDDTRLKNEIDSALKDLKASNVALQMAKDTGHAFEQECLATKEELYRLQDDLNASIAVSSLPVMVTKSC